MGDLELTKVVHDYYMEWEDPKTGERKAFSVEVIFGRIWEDYIRDMLPNRFTRGLLYDLGLSPCEVFHIMELLQGGKAEYEQSDYREVSYV